MTNKLRPIEDIPLNYRCVFQEYPCFNIVQSAVLDDALSTDDSLVISAPTGSGKTAIFEMAIIKHLMLREIDQNAFNNKIVYISPMKALCQERLVDWHTKFADFNVRCISLTSDSDDINMKTIAQYNLLISTPEKWDVLTRRWRDNIPLMTTISLFLIDEVHLLNADSRGSTLEVIVSRMKTAITSLSSYTSKWNVRFIALSATIPNIEDIAEWIGPSSVKHHKFSEEVRPVKLEKIVIGFFFNPQSQSIFKFDMSLNYKLPSLISKYSEGKPTLIFCNTRKSVEMTSNHLVQNLQIRLTQEQKMDLMEISQQLSDSKLKQQILYGIAFHHAGLVHENRHLIEEAFKKGKVPVLVTTSTLAMGVNLPAHLVIVKSTKCYSGSGYKDYDEVSIFQMIGRAGRSQFDNSASALILTSLQDKKKYEKMLGCSQTIESNLHKHLTEHLNAEVVLRTITDLDLAMRWLSSTFLYVRARRSPEKYKLPAGLDKEKIDKRLLEMCQIDLNKLVRAGMIQISEDIEITPTVVGEIMAKYYVAFETMKLFTQISGTEILVQILSIISKCKEFSEIYLRNNDKKCLNLLNKCSKKESIRYPLTGRIKSVDMKVNVIIQAVLGNLEIYDQSILCDSIKIMRSCERLAKCLIEYLETREKCYNALINTIILLKCFKVKLWENSPYISKQLTGVGQVMSRSLMKAGKTNFKEIAKTNPRHIEMLISRKAPFGNTLVEEATHLPDYNMTLIKRENDAELYIILQNPSEIEEKCTISLDSTMTLLVGDSDNNILLYEKYAHSYLIENPEVRRIITLENQNLDFVKAYFISENWVGIDCYFNLELVSKIITDERKTKTTNPAKSKIQNQNDKGKQTYLESYMQCVKRSNITKGDKNKKCNKTQSVENKPELNKKKQFETNKEDTNSKSSQVKQASNKPLTKTKPKESNKKSIHNSFLSDSFANAIIDELEADKLAVEGENGLPFDKFAEEYHKTQYTQDVNKDSNKNETESKECIKHDKLCGKKTKYEDFGEIKFNSEELKNSVFNSLCKKYGHLPNNERPNKDLQQKQENMSKDTMNVNPDSTVEQNARQTIITMCSPHPKRMKKDERYVSAFDVHIPKNIKWRSPLVNSPQVKYSPNCFDFGYPESNKEGVAENNEFRFGAHNTSVSSLASSLSEKRVPIVKAAKRKSKYQFPLSDLDCKEEENEYKKGIKELDHFVDLENFVAGNRQKESLNPTQSSYAGKYYSQIMNSQQQTKSKEKEESIKNISLILQNKPTNNNNNNSDYQQSQDLFSDNILPSKLETQKSLKSHDTFDFISNNQSEQLSRKQPDNVLSFTQPAYQLLEPPTNINFSLRNFVDNRPQRDTEIDCFNRTFVEPQNFKNPVIEEYPHRPLFNPYLDDHRYPKSVSSYFSHQQPCYVPKPPSHHVCCGHYPRMTPCCKPYLDPILEIDPYCRHVENRSLTHKYHSHVNDIPEAYVDNCLQQLDDQSYFVNNNSTNNFVAIHEGPSGFSREPDSLAYENKENNFHPQSQGYRPSFNGFQLQQPADSDLPTSQIRKLPKENISKMFARSSKQYTHDTNRESTNCQPRTLLVPSVPRRRMNFDSFEERLDNIIVPRSQGFSISANRNPNFYSPVRYGSVPNINGKRKFMGNRFNFGNDQNNRSQ